jgi:hypothetical protein
MNFGMRLRRFGGFIGGISGVVLCVACVTQPPPQVVAVQPPPDKNVSFYPAQGQSAERQDRDKYECNGWAVKQSGFDPSMPNTPPHLQVRVAAVEPPPRHGSRGWSRERRRDRRRGLSSVGVGSRGTVGRGSRRHHRRYRRFGSARAGACSSGQRLRHHECPRGAARTNGSQLQARHGGMLGRSRLHRALIGSGTSSDD